MMTVLFGVAGLDALDVDAEAQPPDQEFRQSVERVGAREGHAVFRE